MVVMEMNLMVEEDLSVELATGGGGGEFVGRGEEVVGGGEDGCDDGGGLVLDGGGRRVVEVAQQWEMNLEVARQ
ncbi:hypothetical protein Patl1_20850 [Pistacia atlantica]|uniref:Uncharacterized protein n=1 Tax=Pistacia atlantica TaxID=434234 RepID=A0ACC1BLC8_9ROSI|nr:hypothetical protein Patl1_20850 [Pistacia atlantica]